MPQVRDETTLPRMNTSLKTKTIQVLKVKLLVRISSKSDSSLDFCILDSRSVHSKSAAIFLNSVVFNRTKILSIAVEKTTDSQYGLGSFKALFTHHIPPMVGKPRVGLFQWSMKKRTTSSVCRDIETEGRRYTILGNCLPDLSVVQRRNFTFGSRLYTKDLDC